MPPYSQNTMRNLGVPFFLDDIVSWTDQGSRVSAQENPDGTLTRPFRKADGDTNGNARNGQHPSATPLSSCSILMSCPLLRLSNATIEGRPSSSPQRTPTSSAQGGHMIGSRAAEGCPPFCSVSMLVSHPGYHST